MWKYGIRGRTLDSRELFLAVVIIQKSDLLLLTVYEVKEEERIVKRKRRIRKSYIDYSCGFPISLVNVPEVFMLGEWVLDIDYNQLAKVVLRSLVFQAFPLTGCEVKFIRHYFEMTTGEFSAHFHVAHTAVTKWEGYGDAIAQINWGTELAIRLFVLDRLLKHSKEFRKNYQKISVLDFSKNNVPVEPQFDFEELKIA